MQRIRVSWRFCPSVGAHNTRNPVAGQAPREDDPAGLGRLMVLQVSLHVVRPIGQKCHFTPIDRLLLVFPTFVKPPAFTLWAFW